MKKCKIILALLLIGFSIGITQAQENTISPSVLLKTKTHQVKVYPGWADLFGNTENHADLSTLSSNVIYDKKASQIFLEAPSGFVNRSAAEGWQDSFSSGSMRISFEDEEETIAAYKERYIDFSASLTGLTKDKINFLEEEITLADNRKGVLFFYYSNKVEYTGFLLYCSVVSPSLIDPKNISVYRFSMDGSSSIPLLSENNFPVWKDYIKRVLITVEKI